MLYNFEYKKNKTSEREAQMFLNYLMKHKSRFKKGRYTYDLKDDDVEKVYVGNYRIKGKKIHVELMIPFKGGWEDRVVVKIKLLDLLVNSFI